MAEIGLSVLQCELGTMEDTVKEIEMEIASIKQDRRDSEKSSPDHHENGDHFPDKPFGEQPEISPKSTLNALTANEEHSQLCKYEIKLKELEISLKTMCESNKDIKSAFEAERALLNQQLKNAREEIDEIKLTLNEKNTELQDYRFKYLRAEQQAEELRRHVDVIEIDNKQVTDQIHMEIHKMKLQFQEKLQELSPLPDVLKCTQLQLQEARELQHFFEQSSQSLGLELHDVQEKLLVATSELNKEKREKIEMEERNRQIQDKMHNQIEELHRELNELRVDFARAEELRTQAEQNIQEKTRECEQMERQSQQSQENCTRSLNSQRERMKAMRKSYQTQLSDLETQLIRSRALCSSIHKERDEMRQNLKTQICTSTEHFELAEVRLKGLKAQVAMLKSKRSLATDVHATDDDVVMN